MEIKKEIGHKFLVDTKADVEGDLSEVSFQFEGKTEYVVGGDSLGNVSASKYLLGRRHNTPAESLQEISSLEDLTREKIGALVQGAINDLH